MSELAGKVAGNGCEVPVADGAAQSASYGPAARLTIVLLFLGYTINFIDRQIVTVVVEPLKQAFDLSDTALGLMTGLAFSSLYAIMGVPIAALSDRFTRTKIIAAALCFWGAMTIAFGSARTVWQLFAARMGVGVGESAYGPAAFSLIADYFPKHKRATPTALVQMGATFGTFLGLAGGGLIAQWAGWRTALFVAGLPAIILGILFFTFVKEPVRGLAEAGEVGQQTPVPTFWLGLAAMSRNRPYMALVVGATAAAFVVYGMLQWFPAFLVRSYHLTIGEAGLVVGPLVGVAGAASYLASGVLTDRLVRRDFRWAFWLQAIAAVLTLPCMVLAFTSVSLSATLIFFGAGYFFGQYFSVPAIATIPALIPLRLRARGTAIYLLIVTLLGIGLGPFFAGFLSDGFHERYGTQSLRFALLVMSPVVIIAALSFWWGARNVGRKGEF